MADSPFKRLLLGKQQIPQVNFLSPRSVPQKENKARVTRFKHATCECVKTLQDTFFYVHAFNNKSLLESLISEGTTSINYSTENAPYLG